MCTIRYWLIIKSTKIKRLIRNLLKMSWKEKLVSKVINENIFIHERNDLVWIIYFRFLINLLLIILKISTIIHLNKIGLWD